MINSIFNRIFGTGLVKKLGANAGWVLANQIFKQLTVLLLGIWTVRALGPDDYGLLNWVLVLCFLLSYLIFPGIESLIIRDLIQNKDKTNEILGSYFALRFVGFILMFLVAVFLAYQLKFDSEKYLIFFIFILSYLPSVSKSFEVDFHAQSNFKLVAISQFISFSSAAIYRLLLLVGSASVLMFSTIYLLEAVVLGFVLLLFNLTRGHPCFRWRFNFQIFKSFLTNGWPLVAASVFAVIYMRVDVLMLEYFKGAGEVGRYVAATRLVECFMVIPATIANVTFPVLMGKGADGSELFLRRVRRCLRFSSLIAVSIILFSYFLAPYFIPILYGDRYLESVSVFQISVFSLLFIFLNMFSTSFWMYYESQRIMLMQYSIPCVLNIALNCYMIPAYGAVGAAATAVMTQMSAAILSPLLHPTGRLWVKTCFSALFPRSAG